ncbi:enoyl-CoA hydratase-related protein [Ilumatobacter nonamiensis]|uniref:enoyl-CoA hydratase-related protein n=1 Tax=Ilumatobacter nonamiensis TaxID=467093 RepID=UPI0005913550|nr:enoyl-CoA hydratase-related protein [Ilumatobacter nonamiensis]
MVRTERRGKVELITLDRPDRRNALDHPTLIELIEIQRRLSIESADFAIRAVVLTGAPPAFCAGADLTGVEEGEFTADLGSVLRNFTELPVPVIAAIDGPALGAGTQLVVACDLRIATPDSVLGVPAAKLGLVVDHWTVRRMTTEFGSAVARGMLVGAETTTAEDLHRRGAIHRLGDLDAAMDWAERLAALAPLTLAAHKRGLEDGDAPSGRFDDLRRTAWSSADADEGRRAFLEKRRPDFTGT